MLFLGGVTCENDHCSHSGLFCSSSVFAPYLQLVKKHIVRVLLDITTAARNTHHATFSVRKVHICDGEVFQTQRQFGPGHYLRPNPYLKIAAQIPAAFIEPQSLLEPGFYVYGNTAHAC